jgi:hypothetical protein
MGSGGFLITYFAAGIFGYVEPAMPTMGTKILACEATFLVETLPSSVSLLLVLVVPFLVH